VTFWLKTRLWRKKCARAVPETRLFISAPQSPTPSHVAASAAGGRVPLLRWTHGLINRLVMLADFAVVLAAGLLLHRALLGLAPALSTAQAGLVLLIAAGVMQFTLRQGGAYRVERSLHAWRPAMDMVAGFGAGVLAVAILLGVLAPALLAPWPWLAAWAGGVLVALVLARQIVRLALRGMQGRALLRRRIAVIGTGDPAAALLRQLADPIRAGEFELIGAFAAASPPSAAAVAGPAVAGDVDDLCRYALDNPLDMIVVALPWDQAGEIFRLVEQVQWVAADVAVTFDEGGFRPHSANLLSLAGRSTLQVMYRPLKGTQGITKMVEDYVLGVLALAVAAPVMLAAAIAIRLDSPGPILFRQTRIGYNNKPFTIYKFRTMVPHTNTDAHLGTRAGDPRITRVGAILRKLSIDELPQILNVLRGEMSLVGPRPHVRGMVVGDALLTDTVRQYAARHRIKPGITGWAQVNGTRGAVDSVSKAMRVVELDMYYIGNWSLWFDIKIMLRTLLTGLAKAGAH
jgi:polysaccharide biosynthesis protein PslA